MSCLGQTEKHPSCPLSIVLRTLTSSATFKTLLPILFSVVFTNMMKSNGTRTDPCGTPLMTCCHSDLHPFSMILCSQPKSHCSTQFSTSPLCNELFFHACMRLNFVQELYFQLLHFFKCGHELGLMVCIYMEYNVSHFADVGVPNEIRYLGISVLLAVLSGTEIPNTISVPIQIPNG